MEEKIILASQEAQTCKYNAALNEDIDSVRPDYNYDEVRFQIIKYDYNNFIVL